MDSSELEVAIGYNVRALRIAQRLTQNELSERANVSIGAVKSLERAKGSTISTLVKVLHALGNDAWISHLAPSTSFNPLALLEERRGVGRARGPARVRHRVRGSS